MERKMTLLVVMLMSVLLFSWSRAQAPDLPEQVPDSVKAYRLEQVQYDAVENLVQWGVVEGTMDRSGHFEPSNMPTVVYSLNLTTGEMTRDGVKGKLDLRNENEGLVFDSLSLLMQEYTKKWGETTEPDYPESERQDIIKVAR